MLIKRSTTVKWALLSALACLVLYLTACAYIWTRQERFIFMPQRIIASTPADYDLPFEDIYIAVKGQSDTGERLHGWFIPAAHEPGRKLLLYLHGSALNIGANIAHAQRFRNMGFSVFLPSYRGYGKSDGAFPSEAHVYTDAETAWDYLRKNRDVDPPSIFIYGHSLGGAVAIQLALNHPDAGGLIVEGTFTSIVELAGLLPQYRLLPLNLIINQRFESIKKVGRLKVPILYIHGTNDKRVPYAMTRKLYAHTASPKKMKLIFGGGHNNTAKVGGEEYLRTVREFMRFTRGLISDPPLATIPGMTTGNSPEPFGLHSRAAFRGS